ncbi:hypothetical protein O6H91_08G035900 [Diphasiastrum complanatum]|uniref:Uncharacterized protein n=1 Tax=Diphasiastrum complanatum TaxID=34168 RepID=A0ACC2CWT6_DIPCM|nr:hypothetical protein O6H91_08G035900 [Diphasiastrum complanatum]
MVVVDRFLKQAHSIPVRSTITAEQCARLFLSEIFRLHGFSRTILSDRDSKFTSIFWIELMRILNVQLFIKSAYHSTSDGQSEVLNKILEDYLRHFVTPSEKDWDQHLCLAKYSYNSSVSTSTGVLPFLLSHGLAFLSLLRIHLSHLHLFYQLLESLLPGPVLIYSMFSSVIRPQLIVITRASFQLGDIVYLCLWFAHYHFVRGHASTEKLAPRYYGPYQILEVLSPVTYRL